MVWGASQVLHDYKLFGNFGMNLNSKTELYGWGNYAQRKIEGGFYYRNPNTRGGVFDGGDDTIKVANLDPAQGNCPVVQANAAADYSDVSLPENCFIFNEKFPRGCRPLYSSRAPSLRRTG